MSSQPDLLRQNSANLKDSEPADYGDMFDSEDSLNQEHEEDSDRHEAIDRLLLKHEEMVRDEPDAREPANSLEKELKLK